MRRRHVGCIPPRTKVETSEHQSIDFEVLLMQQESKQYCWSMLPVIVVFLLGAVAPLFNAPVRICYGLTSVGAASATIATGISTRISDRISFLKYVSGMNIFNMFVRTLLHVAWIHFANDFIFGRIVTLFILPLSSTRQVQSTSSFLVYVAFHVALLVYRFRDNFEEGIPWIMGSIIYSDFIVGIVKQKDLSRNSRLHAASAWQTLEKLLSGFCDAVVQLDTSLCIQHPSRQLTYLLHPNSLMNQAPLHGVCFADYLNVSDRERFVAQQQRFQGSETTGLPAAFQVGLVVDNACKHVELFQVFCKGLDGKDHHIAGIREISETVFSGAVSNHIFARDHNTFSAEAADRNGMESQALTWTDAVDKGESHEAKSQELTGNSNEVAQARTLKNHQLSRGQHATSSRSSSSSYSGKVLYASTLLKDISYMYFTLSQLEFVVHEYGSLLKSSDSKNGFMSVERLLKSEQRLEFSRWLQHSANSLCHGGACSKYCNLQFRIPTKSGRRSKELFIAEYVSLQWNNDDPNDNSDNDQCAPLHTSMQLRFENVSEVKPVRRDYTPLNSVDEDHVASTEVCSHSTDDPENV